MNKPKFGADPGRRAGLRKAIDQALTYLTDETKNYSREQFAKEEKDDNLLASKVLATLIRDIADEEGMMEGGWANWLVGWEPLQKAKITPEALEAAIKELKKIKRVRRTRARAELERRAA